MLAAQLPQLLHRVLAEAQPVLRQPAATAERGPETSVRLAGYCVGRPPHGLLINAPLTVRDAGADLARMAYFEAASVEAFLQLKDELEEHRAPLQLVAAAERAARDEVCHAQACGVLARRRGATPAAPQLMRERPRSLEEIAEQNAVEGCVVETFGVLIGLHQAKAAAAADVRATMAFIATDEAEHAGFSLQLAEWLERQLSPASRARIEEARAEALNRLLEQALFAQDVPWRAELGLPHADGLFALAQSFAKVLMSQDNS